MLLTSLSFATDARCVLSYEKADGWLRATWAGYVNPTDALAGATAFLAQAGPMHCLYLLNDNLELEGPWFDSARWLKETWLPQAQRLGLRYVAHVVQTDTKHDTITEAPLNPAACLFELQLFDNVPEAEEWLRSCQAKASVVR